jgi:hypothetical protein
MADNTTFIYSLVPYDYKSLHLKASDSQSRGLHNVEGYI